MAGVLSEIGRKLSRLFLGRIVVRQVGELRRSRSPDVMTCRRDVAIASMRPEPRINAALFCRWRRTGAAAAGSLLCGDARCLLGVSGVNLEKFSGGCAVKKYGLNLKTRARAKNALHRMERLPVTRKNRLPYLKKYPKLEKASLLALYSPLYREKIAKSALDKSSGNLLFWYDNDRVKAGEKNHLLLVRVFGGEEPLKWIWLPVDKKMI